MWLKGGAIFCYSGHLYFLVRLKGGAILCYFLLFSAILGSSATPDVQKEKNTTATFNKSDVGLEGCWYCLKVV